MKRMLFAGLAPAALLVAASASAALADVEKWDVTAANTNYSGENVSGWFDYDTTTSEITNWNVTVNGYFAVNTNFFPPSTGVLKPCASVECNANVSSPLLTGAPGAELNFSNFANPAAEF